MIRNIIKIELLHMYFSKVLNAQSAHGYWLVVQTRNKNAKKYIKTLKISHGNNNMA